MFNRMPFGLINNGSTYQRLMMDETLRSLNGASPYVNDVCLQSNGSDRHLRHLKATFSALKRGNIQLRRDKCSFGTSFGMWFQRKHTQSRDLLRRSETPSRPTRRKSCSDSSVGSIIIVNMSLGSHS